MAVAEKAGVEVDSSGQNLEHHNNNNTVVSADAKSCPNDQNASNPRDDFSAKTKEATLNTDQNITNTNLSNQNAVNGPAQQAGQMHNEFNVGNGANSNGFGSKTDGSAGYEMNGGGKGNGIQGERFENEMRDLVEMLSKLNPMAEEFVPPSLVCVQNPGFFGNGVGFTNNFVVQANSADANGHFARRRRNNHGQGKRRMNKRTSMAQQNEVIRRTVYVSDIDQQVTEEQLAGLFLGCGQVVDCRICGDPNSVLRFAFIEFTDEDGARAALNLSGTILGYYPVKVHPSKTAIAPVNPTFLPRSEDEREMCSRTIYCTNIDKKITQADVKLFFESVCGEVQRLRLLGDYHHQTRIAFVEFTVAESAIAALNCSGAILGTLPIRVSPSKTPVRPRQQFN